ncbi:MAG: ABC transporter ATP-binding protein [Chloroflexaceae bacterium]|nr:ABC transporter ATP-binding protein [Chloroflexaceae bacterium]
MAERNSRHFISCAGLVKIFQVADLEVVALQGLDLEVSRGEMLALVGPSGSGKSTLMSALGGLDRPTAGRLEVDGQNLLKFSQKELTAYRREQVGFVWQQTTRNLLPYLTARENIELLMRLNGSRQRHKRAWASELLEAVGMAEHAHQTPPRLSGGQQQRVAIACALANQPKMLLGDEPTGEVDWATAQRILALLRDLRERFGLTIVMVTHDPRVAEQADRVVAIRDGQTSTEMVQVAGTGETEGDHPEQPSAHTGAAPEPRAFEELVVLDRAGRLQIPGDQRALAKIGRRARVELVEGGILIRPSDDDEFAETPEATGASDSEMTYHSLYRLRRKTPAGEGFSHREVVAQSSQERPEPLKRRAILILVLGKPIELKSSE